MSCCKGHIGCVPGVVDSDHMTQAAKFAKTMKAKGKSNVDMLNDDFDRIDTDQSGELSKKELKEHFGKEEGKRLYSEWDTDHDGVVSKAEWEAAHKDVYGSMMQPKILISIEICFPRLSISTCARTSPSPCASTCPRPEEFCTRLFPKLTATKSRGRAEPEVSTESTKGTRACGSRGSTCTNAS